MLQMLLQGLFFLCAPKIKDSTLASKIHETISFRGILTTNLRTEQQSIFNYFWRSDQIRAWSILYLIRLFIYCSTLLPLQERFIYF